METIQINHSMKTESTSSTLSAENNWDSWFDGPGVTSDFMCQRDQPADQARIDF